MIACLTVPVGLSRSTYLYGLNINQSKELLSIYSPETDNQNPSTGIAIAYYFYR